MTVQLIDPAGDSLKSVAAAIALNNRQLRERFSANIIVGPPGEAWSLEVVAVAVNLGSHAAGAVGEIQVSVPGLAVGDYIEFMSSENMTGGMVPARGFTFRCDPVCTVAGEISFYSFNGTGSTADLPERDFYFRVIHRG